MVDARDFQKAEGAQTTSTGRSPPAERRATRESEVKAARQADAAARVEGRRGVASLEDVALARDAEHPGECTLR